MKSKVRSKTNALCVIMISLGPAVARVAPDDARELTPANSFEAWREPKGQWAFVAEVAPGADNARSLHAKGDSGPILYNGSAGRTANLLTKESFGDVELHAEFLVPKGSNSGIKFEGLYEIQIADSYGKSKADASDCGGIYPRAELLPSYHHIDEGTPPKSNACKAPGEWQTLEVLFRAPRFDSQGKKTANARFEKVVLNSVVVHENVELLYPTGHAWRKPEPATGPLFLQGDHGPVAFRNVRVRPLSGDESSR
jgi:hypothetical protein